MRQEALLMVRARTMQRPVGFKGNKQERRGKEEFVNH